MSERTPEDSTPLVQYAERSLWSNPEENIQYQVELRRITGDAGVVRNYNYMGRWRSLPREARTFHIFSVGGLHPGYWNFKTNLLGRNPLDRWIRINDLCRRRGVQLDLYDGQGYQFSRSHAWIMVTYDNLVLVAFEKLINYPIPSEREMWFRCYTPNAPVSKWEEATDENNPFVYETMIYENPTELGVFMTRYNFLKGKPGYTGVYHNGAFYKGAPNTIPKLAVGDIVEIWHDPSVITVEVYQYKTLLDFYSAMDKKRKLILHPPKVKGDFTVRHFDDNDYYLTARNNRGLYYHRNTPEAIRQLTHVDVAICDELIQNAATFHPDLAVVQNIQITVLVRKTDWVFQWPHEHQRIRYLYRFNDTNILKAMTGERATVPEWAAPELESGSVMAYVRTQWRNVKREAVNLAVGYNAATRVLSENVLRATYLPGARGVEVPITYRAMFTAWEHDANGKLLSYHNHTNQTHYAPKNPTCTMVEFTLGYTGKVLDYQVVNQDTPVDKDYDLRVYVCKWSIDLNELVGVWKDVTGDNTIYTIVNGYVVWKKLDKVNERGILLTNKCSLGYTFELDHLDHSLAFALTEIYDGGGLIFPYSFAEVDVWLNGHPLIEKVDWIWDNQYIYIVNKEFIVEGAQTITVRAHGFYENMDRPNSDTELGFVDGGVIGRFDRYNLRGDRVTRTVINGALYLTDEVPRAEREVPDDHWNVLNGRPYCVKHIYAPIKWVEDYKNFPLRARSRATDQRVSDYLTMYLPKPSTNAEEIHYELNDPGRPMGSGVPVLPNLQDKYRVYSPFMSVVVNAIINRLITVPNFGEGETTFSNQQIQDLVKPFIWWLKYDPVTLNFDRRYFAIMPYVNYGTLTITAKEMVFLIKVNELYLKSVCAIEGHFNVNDNVR